MILMFMFLLKGSCHSCLVGVFLGVTLARIPPFQQAFLSQPDGLESVQEACVFTGPPSPMFGDVPWFGMWKQMAERD